MGKCWISSRRFKSPFFPDGPIKPTVSRGLYRGLGFRVLGLGFRLQGISFRV